jgi:hypothetical protein
LPAEIGWGVALPETPSSSSTPSDIVIIYNNTAFVIFIS